jgi:RHS repeat-associated protein
MKFHAQFLRTPALAEQDNESEGSGELSFLAVAALFSVFRRDPIRGEQYDPDLGLYYLRARYYNPATGRFLSRDPEDHSPKNPNELHKYLYAGGDPVNATDPTGRGDGLVSYVLGVTIPLSVIQVVAFETIACGVMEHGGAELLGYQMTGVDTAFCKIEFWLSLLILPDLIPVK